MQRVKVVLHNWITSQKCEKLNFVQKYEIYSVSKFVIACCHV